MTETEQYNTFEVCHFMHFMHVNIQATVFNIQTSTFSHIDVLFLSARKINVLKARTCF